MQAADSLGASSPWTMWNLVKWCLIRQGGLCSTWVKVRPSLIEWWDGCADFTGVNAPAWPLSRSCTLDTSILLHQYKLEGVNPIVYNLSLLINYGFSYNVQPHAGLCHTLDLTRMRPITWKNRKNHSNTPVSLTYYCPGYSGVRRCHGTVNMPSISCPPFILYFISHWLSYSLHRCNLPSILPSCLFLICLCISPLTLNQSQSINSSRCWHFSCFLPIHLPALSSNIFFALCNKSPFNQFSYGRS